MQPFSSPANGLARGSSNSSCGDSVCDDVCYYCEHAQSPPRCEKQPCFNVPSGECKCPRLSEETLVAVGAVVLCLVLLLLAMAVWHWRRCGEMRATTVNTTDYNESLLASHSRGTADREAWGRATRGRTSVDSTVSCIVCMDAAINCVLMPCAHEVACLRCSQRLHLCPVCRTAVDATMKIHVASHEMLLEAALERAREHPTHSTGTLPDADAEMRSAVEDSPSSAAAAQAQDVEAATAEPTATVQVLPSVAGGEGAPAAEADGAQATAKSVEMLCLRCAKLPPNCVFLPCAHKVWCVECAAELPPTCPICNTGISQSLRTFHKRLG